MARAMRACSLSPRPEAACRSSEHVLVTISAQRRADASRQKAIAGELNAKALAIAKTPLYRRDLLAFARAVLKVPHAS